MTGGDDAAACADHIATLLQGDEPDPELLERARTPDTATHIYAGVAQGYRGVDQRDVEMCLEFDQFDFAMTATIIDNHLTLTRSNAIA